MQLVYSHLNKKEKKAPAKQKQVQITYLQINRHFSSLEARIMVIERFIYRFNQIEELRTKMIRIA